MQMPLHLSWHDIVIRLLLTLLAGALIGFNRESRGHAAGFRTCILICLAASVAMIQGNLLLDMVGKAPDSFSHIDILRMPLGILTGVGFIGGGTILKKGELVTGVTTAATLWITTVIGLCFGGGQLILGMAATFLCILTVWLLRWVDFRISREKHAFVLINMGLTDKTPPDLDALIKPLGYHAHFYQLLNDVKSNETKFLYEISWSKPESSSPPVDLIAMLQGNFDIESFEIKSESIKQNI
jgi:putative Mg2+ transporter-C (MgtC) family protein